MYIIDRIENGVVVIETPHGLSNVDNAKIAGEFCEGSVLLKKDGKFYVDTTKTEKRRKKMLDLQNSLFDD